VRKEKRGTEFQKVRRGYKDSGIRRHPNGKGNFRAYPLRVETNKNTSEGQRSCSISKRDWGGRKEWLEGRRGDDFQTKRTEKNPGCRRTAPLPSARVGPNKRQTIIPVETQWKTGGRIKLRELSREGRWTALGITRRRGGDEKEGR